jgi:hypothetical protein
MKMNESRQVDTLKNKEKWLEAHRKYGIVTASCQASKTPRATVYKWLNEEPDFAKVFVAVKAVLEEYVFCG